MAEDRSAVFAGTPHTIGGFRDLGTDDDLHRLRVSAANGVDVTRRAEKNFGGNRFQVDLVDLLSLTGLHT
jgi:hypothetical protein